VGGDPLFFTQGEHHDAEDDPLRFSFFNQEVTTMLSTILRAPQSGSLTLDEMRKSLPAIFATDQHESRSDKYVFVNTEDVLAGLMREGFAPTEARVSHTRDEGRQGYTKHLVRMRPQSDMRDLQVGDAFFEVHLRNAHDGTSSYVLGAGLFRLLCRNGLAVDSGTIESVRVRHCGNRERQLKQVVDGARRIIEQAPAALEAPRVWPTISLSRDEQKVFAEAAHTVRFGDAEGNVDTPITPEQLLHPRRPQDEGSDLWRTFNRVQENVIRGGLQGSNRRRGVPTREVRSIDTDLRLNRALWRLASEMAKLKAA
jgi:hypothetical protein